MAVFLLFKSLKSASVLDTRASLNDDGYQGGGYYPPAGLVYVKLDRPFPPPPLLSMSVTWIICPGQ